MLSNPFYIEFLIENQFFEDKNFIYYLKYLEYLKDERTFKLIRYPIAWKILENIQNLKFIEMWKSNKSVYTNFLNDQLFAHSVFLTQNYESKVNN